MSTSPTHADAKLGSKLQGGNPGRSTGFNGEEHESFGSAFYCGHKALQSLHSWRQGREWEATALRRALPSLQGHAWTTSGYSKSVGMGRGSAHGSLAPGPHLSASFQLVLAEPGKLKTHLSDSL